VNIEQQLEVAKEALAEIYASANPIYHRRIAKEALEKIGTLKVSVKNVKGDK